MNRLTFCFLNGAVLCVTSMALAQAAAVADSAPATPARSLGRQGQITLSAERLFGVSYTTASDSSASVTTISLIGSSGYELVAAPYSTPRLAIDVFAVEGLSLGLGAHFANIAASGSSRSITTVGVNPRIGYAIYATNIFTFWPRAGISYVSIDAGD
ncbi:MAG TPA: hypothetical protein VIV60_29540, partial [Polyangiaceae bacterium]